MINFNNKLQKELEVHIEDTTYVVRPGEALTVEPESNPFSCKTKINCKSSMSINWLALWTGFYTGEQIKPKIICNSEFTFEGIDGEITFYRSTSRPANEICFIGADCVCEGVECKDKKYSIKNKVAFLLKFLFVTLGITSCIPIGLVGLWLAHEDAETDFLLTISSIGVILLGLPASIRILLKMIKYYRDNLADFYLNLPVKQRHDYDQIEFELEKGEFTEKTGIIKKLIELFVRKMLD